MHKGVGQNLLQNPGFEEYTACPENASTQPYPTELSKAIGWDGCENSFTTPDYLHICGTHPGITVPFNNYFGFSYPNSGSAFAGFFCFSKFLLEAGEFNSPEVIQNILESQNTAFKRLFISVYVKVADFSGFVTNNLSIKLLNGRCTGPSNPPISQNTADFTSCEVIEKQEEWTLLSGTFIPNAVYEKLIVSNFYDLEHSIFREVSGASYDPLTMMWQSSYYFIDDVCLSHNPASCPARQLDLLPPTATCVDGQVVLDAGPGSVHYA